MDGISARIHITLTEIWMNEFIYIMSSVLEHPKPKNTQNLYHVSPNNMLQQGTECIKYVTSNTSSCLKWAQLAFMCNIQKQNKNKNKNIPLYDGSHLLTLFSSLVPHLPS